MPDLPIEDLVSASLRGDVRAFGTLVERYYPAVTAVAFAVTRDLAQSEDIAQETFLVAWSRLAELRDPASVRAWLCNIARNQSKNELRRRTREAGPPDDNVVDARPGAAEVTIAREAEAHVRVLLDELPETYREPLVLFYWQERSIKEVASTLELSEQAAQQRISRARSMIGDQHAARFEEAARARRPAKAAAAGILAVLAARPTPTAAAAAASGFTMTTLVKIALSLVLALGFALVIWRYVDRDSAVAAPTSTTTTTTATATTNAKSPPVVPAASAPTAVVQSGAKKPAAAKGGFGSPDAYEITILGPTSVAIELAGGKSQMTSFRDPPPPTFERRVRGHVRDESGRPIAGAVVVIGTRFRIMWGALTASRGAMTNLDGSFDVAVHSEAAQVMMALHPRMGWSTQIAVPAGRGDAKIDVNVQRPARFSGQVKRDGEPIEADVLITAGDSPSAEGSPLVIDFPTDANGRFELPLLAPGMYRIAARPKQQFAGGAGYGGKQTVVLASGSTKRIEVDITIGTLLVVTTRDAKSFRSIEYVLVPGIHESLDAAALRALSREGKATAYLLGGVDADRPMQFHDVAPGEYTLCVMRKVDRSTTLPITCQRLSVPAGHDVIDLEVK